MSDRDSFGSFLVGFLVGGVAGAVVALLYAPQSGDDTRVQIKDKAIELKDKTTVAFDETYHKAEGLGKEAVTKAQGLIKTAQTKASETLKKGQVVLEEIAVPAKPKSK
jgi:gas vesicle protein